MKELKVKFALADSGYMTALRLVAGAVCSLHDVDLELTEDFKVCVTESALILKNGGFEYVEAEFSGDRAACTVTGIGGGKTFNDNEFSLALVSALVSDCKIERQGGVIYKVALCL